MTSEKALQSKIKQLRRSGSIRNDVQFKVVDNDMPGVSQDEDFVMIGAHKLVLALGSPVFKRQFCGPMRDEALVVSIVDSSPEVFRVFIKCFYEDVDISQKSVQFLCDLYYLGDKYCIEELKVSFCRSYIFDFVDPLFIHFIFLRTALLRP